MAMGRYKIVQEIEEVSTIHGTVSEPVSLEYYFAASNLMFIAVLAS
jgi:hypothetical protein